MTIKIKTVHFKADKTLIDFAESKVNKLIEKNETVLSVECSLVFEKSEKVNNKQTEIMIKLAKQELFAKKQADTFEQSVDLAVEAIRKQLSKSKDKK